MSETPFFSIIIPLFNKEKDILHTLQSLKKQTFTCYEVVVIDDGSTDRSPAIVKGFKDERIKFYTKKNEGVAKTRNIGVVKAIAQHIVFLDADDYWYPNHLENIAALIKKYPKNRWYATAYEKKHNHKFTTSMISPVFKENNEELVVVDNYFKYSLVDALAWTSAVCFKKDFFEELGGFDSRITMGAGEDTDLWLRAAIRAPLAFSKMITARHNLDSSNRISNSPTLSRNYMDVDVYENVTTYQPFLKRYLDINRFSFALQHKIAGDIIATKKYLTAIDPKNLSTKQKWILKSPKIFLIGLWNLKKILEKLKIRVSVFK